MEPDATVVKQTPHQGIHAEQDATVVKQTPNQGIHAEPFLCMLFLCIDD
jgi:hypothetical protein